MKLKQINARMPVYLTEYVKRQAKMQGIKIETFMANMVREDKKRREVE